MNIKYTIPSIYRANTLSLCAWIWIEAMLYYRNQMDLEGEDYSMNSVTAAKLFQEFWGLEEDDFGVDHIRMSYFRMKKCNAERKEEPMPFPRDNNVEIMEALNTIKEYLEKDEK